MLKEVLITLVIVIVVASGLLYYFGFVREVDYIVSMNPTPNSTTNQTLEYAEMVFSGKIMGGNLNVSESDNLVSGTPEIDGKIIRAPVNLVYGIYLVEYDVTVKKALFFKERVKGMYLFDYEEYFEIELNLDEPALVEDALEIGLI